MTQPPFQQPGTPEHLGSPHPSQQPASPKGRRTGYVAGGIVGVLAVGGAAAWAATSFFATGAQPAEALPAATVAYLSVDLDPSGGQKIEAVKTLRKFPELRDSLKLSGRDDADLRAQVFDDLIPKGCAVTYHDDVKPWLGNRFAIGVVDTGAEEPVVVAAVQVTDGDAALKGAKTLAACEDDAPSKLPVTVRGDWMLVSDTAANAEQVADLAEKKPLAADATFKKWSDKVGGAGLVNIYAGPAAGDLLADLVEQSKDDLTGLVDGQLGSGADFGSGSSDEFGSEGFTSEDFASEDFASDDTTTDEFASDEGTEPETMQDYLDMGFTEDEVNDMGLLEEAPDTDGLTDDFSTEFSDEFGDVAVEDNTSTSKVADEAISALRKFKGVAATLRFNDGTLEFESVSDSGNTTKKSSSDAGDLVGSLPKDSAAAFGLTLGEGWASDLLDQAVKSSDGKLDRDEIISEAKQASGLTIPEDAEALLGDGIAFVVGSDIDVKGLENAEGVDDLSGLSVGLKVLADKEEVDRVLDLLLANLPEETATEISDLLKSAGGKQTVISPSSDYRDQLAKEGSLADSERYQKIVDGGDWDSVLFVNLEPVKKWVADLDGVEADVSKNIEPLDAIGMTVGTDKGTTRLRFRIATK